MSNFAIVFGVMGKSLEKHSRSRVERMVRDGKEHQKDADFVNGEAPDQPLTG
jgi:hypothetical protein